MASDPATARNLLLVTSPPTSSGPGMAFRMRQLARRRGSFPGYDLSAAVGQAVILNEWSDLWRFRSGADIAELVIAYPAEPAVLRQLAAVAHTAGLGLVLAPANANADARSQPRAGMRWSGTVLPAPRRATYRPTSATTLAVGVTRAVDIVGALVIGAITLPFLIAAVIAVELDSPGRAFFSQTRIGASGRPFRIWKLRTMRRSSEPYARSPAHDDPDVTRVGRALRMTGLDELPQLLNVLRGEMRLVGPRPEMPFIVDKYTALQRERLAAVPGITGLWQLRGNRAAAMHDQIEYDFYYIAFRTLVLDARILLETARFAVRGAGRVFAPRRPAGDAPPTAYSAPDNTSAANHE